MRKKRRAAQDAIEAAIEAALCPGRFINYNASWSFVEALATPAGAIEELVRADPQRAVRLYETFLAGCYEKANELDDSSGSFGMFVDDLYAVDVRCGVLVAGAGEVTYEERVGRIEGGLHGLDGGSEGRPQP